MTSRIILTIAASLVTISASMHVAALPHQAVAQTSGDGAWTGRTLWGDPDLQGEWTAEGEYGVPFERPPQFGTRQLLTDEEYAKRLEDVRIREDNAGVYEYAVSRGEPRHAVHALGLAAPRAHGPGRDARAGAAMTDPAAAFRAAAGSVKFSSKRRP